LTNSDYIPQRLFYNDCAAACDIEKATMFNNYFYSVFTSSGTTSPVDNTVDINVEQQIVCITISECDTYEAFSSLNPCKALGMDDIGPRVLKSCAVFLYKPFHYLYNLILRQHCLPLEWCIHCIVPIFKSGDKSSVSDYRPVYTCIVQFFKGVGTTDLRQDNWTCLQTTFLFAAWLSQK